MIICWLLLSLALCTVCEAECPDDAFSCENGHCVPKRWWCDGTEDCSDGTDEKYCSRRVSNNSNPNGCDESFFLCKDGVCIPKTGRCDGEFTCPDGSDEQNCGTSHTNKTEIPLQVTTTSTKLEEATTALPTTTVKATAPRSAIVLQHDHDLSQTNHPVAVNKSGNKHSDVDNNSVLQNYTTKNTSDSSEASEHRYPAAHAPIYQNTIDSNETSTFVKHLTDDSTSQNAIDFDEALKHDVLQADSTVTANNSNKDFNSQPSDIAKANHDDDSPVRNNSENNSTHRDVPPPHFRNKEEDLKYGFLAINSRDYRIQRSNAQKWLTKIRDENYGWGDETVRAVTALYMSGDELTLKQSEKLLMSNQLKLRLFSALMRNVTKQVPLVELALYINALSVSCENPRNFYGHDLVDILRQRTDVAQKSTLVAPFVYLALCLNNATSRADVGKLHKFLHDPQNTYKIGIEAMVFLASTCMYRSSQGSDSQQGLATRFLHRIRIEGFPKNIYDLALLAQGLNEAGINPDLWNRSEVMNLIMASQQIDGSFGDILSTYYVMPLLSGRSLASFNEHCEIDEEKSLVPVEVLKSGKAEKSIKYVLRYGDPMEMSQTLRLSVKKSTSVFDIMRISATLNPAYRFRYVMSHGKPSVYSIGGVGNDAEKGRYWSLYMGSHQQHTEDLVLFEGDIRSFIPSYGQHVVFWLKPVF